MPTITLNGVTLSAAPVTLTHTGVTLTEDTSVTLTHTGVTLLALGPVLTNPPDQITSGSTIALTGENWGAVAGSISLTSEGQAQVVSYTGWTDTGASITVPDVESTLLAYGSATLRITHDNGGYTDYPITLIPANNDGYVLIGTPHADPAKRIQSAPEDLVTGDQIVYDTLGGMIQILDNGSVEAHSSLVNGTYAFNTRIRHATSGAWGDVVEQSVTIDVPVTASASIQLPAISLSGTAEIEADIVVSGAIVLPAFQVSGASEVIPLETVTALGAITLPALSMQGVLDVVEEGITEATGSLVLPAINLSGVASIEQEITIDGSIVLPAIQLSGSLDLDIVIPAKDIYVTASIELPAFELGGSAEVVQEIVAAGNITLPAINISGGVSFVQPGEVRVYGAITLPEIRLAGETEFITPAKTITASGSIALPAFVLQSVPIYEIDPDWIFMLDYKRIPDITVKH
jgi:hypothetical protein